MQSLVCGKKSDDLYLYFKKGDKIRVYEDRLICLGKEKNLLCIKQCHQVTYPSILKYNKSKHTFIKENRILFLCEKDVYYYASSISFKMLNYLFGENGS